uniref:LOW QUALITY PROTEIN: FT-interacting protein 3-like n=1 Tax=Elaeis guineensis var. tenera TaxID=51953 RepID=A0A8N4IG58_ELAGV|nr:LOW QUALITY PROTEIN: FT-interacting protein 3-like [Elaeis guineensis]
MQRPLPREDYSLREIYLGGEGTYGLVEEMEYYFVRIMKAENLSPKDVTGSCNPYVEVRLGSYKGTTSHFEQKTDLEWNQVFVFPRDQIQASTNIVVVVKDKYAVNDEFIGMVEINLDQILRHVGPDGERWYSLEDQKRNKVGELSFTVWIATQTDKAFLEARHLDAQTVSGDRVVNTGSKVYPSPKLWYVDVVVDHAQDLQIDLKAGYPEIFVRGRIGNQDLRTRNAQWRDGNPFWYERLMFVAAEPFEEHLVISVERRLGVNKDESLGKTDIIVQNVERSSGIKPVPAVEQWYYLHVDVEEGDRRKKEVTHASRILLRICLKGGDHVFDEAPQYSSDLRPSAEELWRESIGTLELGILGARELKIIDGRQATNAYCVAKYGHKWVRTRTVINNSNPRWNEQYAWEVYDPHTVFTVGVFDDCRLLEGGAVAGQDGRIGKVRIRLSTLETGRVYAHSYPLIVLEPWGLTKMGELRLAVRFACSSMLRMMHMYTQPVPPEMHHVYPLSRMQLDNLRHAIQIISTTLSRAEPPLKKEVVEYMTDVASNNWSIRRSKATFFRLMAVLGCFFEALRWFDQIRNWKNPWTTVVIHLVFVILVLYPELILPAVFLYLFLVSVWNRRFWPRHPPHMNVRLSQAENLDPDQLEEEFDTNPTSQSADDVVRTRYDRLRGIMGRLDIVFGYLATQGERLQSLRSGRDPRATNLFTVVCLLLAIVLYFRPRIVALLTGLYVMRHPRFRRPRRPRMLFNFFLRLPNKADMLF